MEAESIRGVEEDVRLADVPLPSVDIRVPNGGELKASPCSALNINRTISVNFYFLLGTWSPGSNPKRHGRHAPCWA